jgi:multidrug efflux system outer membrane protein
LNSGRSTLSRKQLQWRNANAEKRLLQNQRCCKIIRRCFNQFGRAWQGRLTASYEVDLFGRVAGNINAAQADAAAGEALYRSVLLALQADVAQTYFKLRGADAEQALLDETVPMREENVRINPCRFELLDAQPDLVAIEGNAVQLRANRATTTVALIRALGGGWQKQ